MKKLFQKRELSTTQVIALGFFVTILIGAVLLWLPISAAEGYKTSLLDALFTATTSVCVTGLVVVPTYQHWSIFGQAVILCLIQCGGLGIVTLTTSVMIFIGKKVTLKNRLLIEDALNLSTLSGLIKFLKKVLKGTFLVEAIGAVCYSFTFIPEYGFGRGLWISIFNAVSAFCNAGIDIIGDVSLMAYASNYWVCSITMLLIILGGIGYIVWWDLIRVERMVQRREVNAHNFFLRLNLHTKIVLVVTAALILGGTVLIFVMEYSNPATIGNFRLDQKILAALFQSVTTRTAGFLTISQKGLRDSTALLCMVLMFIGGSSVGTAGGIKTTTFAIMALAAIATVKKSDEVVVFRRTIPLRLVRKATAVAMISLVTVMAATMLLSFFCPGDFTDIAFEITSAMGTVGLTRDYTGSLNTFGKIMIIIVMYLGRIGPISMAIAFSFKGKKEQGTFKYPDENITVG